MSRFTLMENKINHFNVYFLSTAETQLSKIPLSHPDSVPLPLGLPSMRCTDAPTLRAWLKIAAACMDY